MAAAIVRENPKWEKRHGWSVEIPAGAVVQVLPDDLQRRRCEIVNTGLFEVWAGDANVARYRSEYIGASFDAFSTTACSALYVFNPNATAAVVNVETNTVRDNG